jgi:hypothetical protein
MKALAEALAEATYGSDVTVEHNGRTYRARVEADTEHSIFDDGDWMGILQWATVDRDTGRPSPRPAGFDGRARKLQSGRGDPIWWQPPADVADDDIRSLGRTILDLLENGYVGVIVERLDGTDAYGRPIVTAVASLWGIGGLDEAYAADVIGDLLTELEAN